MKEEIEIRLGASVVLENDANAAALGEQWLGAASHVDDMCMITLGNGVGGGIVLQGRIWHGMTGMANELGHITVEPDGAPCGCGSFGCLEQYASATAVKRMAIEAVAKGEAPELGRTMNEDPEFSAKVVYQMSVQGDEPAHRRVPCSRENLRSRQRQAIDCCATHVALVWLPSPPVRRGRGVGGESLPGPAPHPLTPRAERAFAPARRRCA